MGISFDVDMEDMGIAKALEKASKQFPETAEKVLKKEARNVAKDLKVRVGKEAAGENSRWKSKGETEDDDDTKHLRDSFTIGKVIRHGSKFTVSVNSRAPHYHLYEEGHIMVGHKIRSKKNKKKIQSYKFLGEVHGKKTVAKYMAQRSEYAELIGRELLNEILKEAGFDS